MKGYIFLLCFLFAFENIKNVTANTTRGKSSSYNLISGRGGNKKGIPTKRGKNKKEPSVKCDPNPCMCYIKGDVSNPVYAITSF